MYALNFCLQSLSTQISQPSSLWTLRSLMTLGCLEKIHVNSTLPFISSHRVLIRHATFQIPMLDSWRTFPPIFIWKGTLAFHPLSSSTPGGISSLCSHEGNDYFWLPLIGMRYATVQSWEFLVCLRNKSDSWIMIGLCKNQCIRTLLRCCHQNRKKKKIKFYSEWTRNNSWKLQPPTYNLFTKNLFEGNYLGEFCATLMFANATL